MKEWKNNPESDEESTTDQRDSGSGQEDLKVYQPSRNVPNVSNSSDEEEGKQVGKTNKTSRKNNYFISPNWYFSKYLHNTWNIFATLFYCWIVMVCNKRDLHDKESKA